MDLNLLVLNVGNTRLSIGAFVAGELKSVVRVAHTDKSDWPRRLADAWQLLGYNDGDEIAAATVNPPLTKSIEQAVMAATEQPIRWVGPDIDLPIKVKTENPLQTGVDRILNIAAAHEQLGKAAVVIDAGTALTIDCCNDEGEFLGGAILPGAEMMLESLHEKTANLPRVPLAQPTGRIGQNTQQAILQGVHTGIRGVVKELVENYATELGQWPEVIATGGDAAKLFANWEIVQAISPDLTLYGIALAYANHQIKYNP
jgi:type III pantothenate kinase